MHTSKPIPSQSVSSREEHIDSVDMPEAIPSSVEHETAAELGELLDFAEKVSANIGTLESLKRRYIKRSFVFLPLGVTIMIPIALLLPDLQASEIVKTEVGDLLLTFAWVMVSILAFASIFLSFESYLAWVRTRDKLGQERELMAQLIRTLSKRVEELIIEERYISGTKKFIFEERLRRLSFKGDRWYTTLP